LWSSFGATYTDALQTIVDKVAASTGVSIQHESKGGYPEIRREMISAVAAGDYPNLATGYPDHFISYLGSEVLTPLDDMFTQEEINDYYEEYLTENRFYDNGGNNAKLRLYGVPFNKSTELLGYNGVFVDYCASLEADLGVLPATWQDWAVKGPRYRQIFNDIIGSKIYGIQDVDGTAHSFATAPFDGGKLLLDLSQVDKDKTLLMAWDSPENALITLIRQWGARYTELPEDQATKTVKRRKGSVWFTSDEDSAKVVKCLRFFSELYHDEKGKIFGLPGHLGSSYASSAFENCKVMFMICSSGGLSYNTAKWNHRFRVAPIPYYAGEYGTNKYVISQGANICLTNKEGSEDAFKVLKALTSSEFQTEWCLKTGYFPASKTAANSQAYTDFINSTDYSAGGTAVAFREGAAVNKNIYTKESEGWHKFVDPAFEGSAILRESLSGVLKTACEKETTASDADFRSILNAIKAVPDLVSLTGKTIEFK